MDVINITGTMKSNTQKVVGVTIFKEDHEGWDYTLS